jgi:hypothetical protein
MENLTEVMDKVNIQMNQLIEILNVKNKKVEQLTRENLELKDKLQNVYKNFIDEIRNFK